MMRYVGTLSAWNDEKGYGFITPRGGGKEVFLHITACRLPERPYQGLAVSYELGTDGKGRPRAERVFPADWQPEETSSVPLAVPVAFSFLGLAALLGQTLLRGSRSGSSSGLSASASLLSWRMDTTSGKPP